MKSEVLRSTIDKVLFAHMEVTVDAVEFVIIPGAVICFDDAVDWLSLSPLNSEARYTWQTPEPTGPPERPACGWPDLETWQN